MNLAASFIRDVEYPLSGPADLDPLIDLIGNSRFVLLGDSNYGAHESFQWRIRLTRRLVTEKHFSCIAVAGSWSHYHKINQYINCVSDQTLHELSGTLEQWPKWAWMNCETAAFIEWLRMYNLCALPGRQVQIYGLDLYEEWESFGLLEKLFTNPETRDDLCFTESIGSYLHAICPPHYRDVIVALLANLHNRRMKSNVDEFLTCCLCRNEMTRKNDERYLREMITSGTDSWNNRDQRMAEILNNIVSLHGPQSKVIVWDHNSHIGDVRATETKFNGIINLGQLLMEQHKEDGIIRVGSGSFNGSILAGKNWCGNTTVIPLRPATPASWEGLLHEAGGYDKLILCRDLARYPVFFQPIDHRSIGLIHDCEIEDLKDYVLSIIPKQYEAFIFLDKTTPLHKIISSSACAQNRIVSSR